MNNAGHTRSLGSLKKLYANPCSFERNGRRQIWCSSFPIKMNLAQEQSHQKILRKLRHKFTRKGQQIRDEQLVMEYSPQENIKF
jgi:hypothetical protein